MSLNKLLGKYYSRSCISIKLSGTQTIRYVVQMVCHAEMFHDYVLSIHITCCCDYFIMMCKLHYGIGPRGKDGFLKCPT